MVLQSGGRVTVERSDVSHEDIRPGFRCGFRPRVSATGTRGAVRRAFKAMDSIGGRVAEQVIDAVEERFAAPRTPGLAGTLAGQPLSGDGYPASKVRPCRTKF